MRAIHKKIKTDDGFTDFKHHASSWRNSKKLRQRNRRKKLKSDISREDRIDERAYNDRA